MKKFTKDDLKTGMVVKVKSGWCYLVLKDCESYYGKIGALCGMTTDHRKFGGVGNSLDDYNDDLTWKFKGHNEDLNDIVKVYKPQTFCYYLNWYDGENYDVVWERFTIEKAREMFNKLIKSLINDINEIIDDHLEMIKVEREDYETVSYHIMSMEGWFATIEQLKKLKLDKKGIEFLDNYYDERGFDKNEYEDLKDVLK